MMANIEKQDDLVSFEDKDNPNIHIDATLEDAVGCLNLFHMQRRMPWIVCKQSDTSWQDGVETGAFLTYEDVLRPYIEQAIKQEDGVTLERASDFIENLFVNGGAYAKNIITVGIIEGLKANCNASKVEKLLRPETLKEFKTMDY